MPMMMRTERIYRSRAGTSTPRGTNTEFCDFAISLRVKKKKKQEFKKFKRRKNKRYKGQRNGNNSNNTVKVESKLKQICKITIPGSYLQRALNAIKDCAHNSRSELY